MASTSIEPFRLLDLPSEIRQLIYIKLFSDSAIAITRSSNTSSETSASPTRGVDLNNYQFAVTLTSHFVRDESLAILHAATILWIPVSAVQDEGYYPLWYTSTVLSHVQKVAFMHIVDDLEFSILDPLSLLPDLKSVCVCLDVGNFCDDRTGLDTLDEWNSVCDRGSCELTDSGKVPSLAVLEKLGDGWIKAAHAECNGFETAPKVKVLLMAELESTHPDPTIAQYGLVSYDGNKTTTCEFSKEEVVWPKESEFFEYRGFFLDTVKD